MKAIFGYLAAAALAVCLAAGSGAVSAYAADEPLSEEIFEPAEATDISDCVLNLERNSFTYTGEPVSAASELTVTCDEMLLVPEEDYTVEFENNTEVGYLTAVMHIKGIGRFCGEAAVPFSISPAPVQISSLTTGNDGMTVRWEAAENVVGYQILYAKDEAFTEELHSTTVSAGKTSVNICNIPKAGELWYTKVRAFITSDGTVKGGRFGEYGEPLSITVRDDIREVTLSSTAYIYTGKALTPVPKVIGCSGNVLKAGVDYTVTYENNTEIGLARMTVIGTEDHQGTFTKEFAVVRTRSSITKLTSKNDAIKVEWKENPEAEGYQVQYSTDPQFVNNVHSTSPVGKTSVSLSTYPKAGETWYVRMRSYVTYNGKRFGKYSSVKKITVKGKLSKVTLASSNIQFTGKKLTPKVIVVDVNGKKLAAGKDYTASYSKNVYGPGVVKITGIGMYEGSTSIKTTFKIKNADLEGRYLLKTKDVIAKACSVLGAPYGWGGKGADKAYYPEPKAWTAVKVKRYGLDCSGLVHWIFLSEGVTISHTDPANLLRNPQVNNAVLPLPLDTPHYLSGRNGYKDFTITVNGKTSPMKLIRNKLYGKDYNYYKADDGSVIPAGSIVIGNNSAGTDHMWIYLGYAKGGKKGIKDLLKKKYGITGISDKNIIYDPAKGNRWRIESLGKKGVVISNTVKDGDGFTGTVAYRICTDYEDE